MRTIHPVHKEGSPRSLAQPAGMLDAETFRALHNFLKSLGNPIAESDIRRRLQAGWVIYRKGRKGSSL